jgi:hypothetical protein
MVPELFRATVPMVLLTHPQCLLPYPINTILRNSDLQNLRRKVILKQDTTFINYFTVSKFDAMDGLDEVFRIILFFFTFSIVRYSWKYVNNTTFRKLDLFPSSDERGRRHLLSWAL